MSANLDVVRSIFAEWERGDFSSAEWAHPEIEFTWVDGPSPGHWTGLPGMAQAMRELLTAWEGYRVEADNFRELDGERVLVTLHAHGRGKSSGIELHSATSSRRGANVFQLRDGRVTSIRGYYDRERALADLGLADR
jgi:ketosteroid isomerase-like protein